ncbi:unnamed protein product [Discula destructiva]
MFKRANSSFESLNNKVPPQARSDLAKKLFPSSSPTAPQNGNIKDQFQKRSGSSYAKTSQSSEPSATAPLQSRSSNTYPPPRPAQSKQPFASLYRNENAFKEEPDLIDLTDDMQSSATRGQAVVGVDLYEDDFSDDDNLDLDFQRPSALPAPPPKLAPAQTRATPAKQAVQASLEDNSSVISWSQSSPSHFEPKSLSTSQTSTKRSFPEDDLAPMQPVAKKRTLPLPYQKYQKTTEETSRLGQQKPTSDKGPLTWDLSPNAVKAQQRKLKDKGKKAAPGAEAIAEEMQQAVKSHTVRQSAISLSKEQEVVKDLVCDKGKSVFFTGPAGTGKSVLMRAIIAQLKKKYAKDPDRLAVTASTGLAACNIGGMTLHSFSGIGLGKDDVATLVKKIRRNAKAKNRWLRTKILVIDEISMVDGDLFDKLSQVGRTLRNNGRPWGGIQLVITGDFFQLPPVPDHNTRDIKFAFEAATWNTSIDHTIGLTEVFRQKDPVFAQMLNEMRLGHISDETVKTFRSMARPLGAEGGIEVTELFPTRSEVEQSNQRKLRELPGELYRYDAMDSGDPLIRDKLLSNMMAPKVLELKKGAQVMLIKNIDDTLVNGSLGTVTGFSTEAVFEISGGYPGDEREDDEVDPSVKKRLAAFGRELDKSAGPDKKKWPMVQFHAVDGTSRMMLCTSEPWKVETPTGEVQASREQLPLILAWALSIHKAQGQTLARVKVNLGKVFEKGQAYVALSRAVTQEGLQVLNFDKQKVMAHPRVVTFYQKLYSAESAAKPDPDKRRKLDDTKVAEQPPAPKKLASASITGFVKSSASRTASRTASRPASMTYGGGNINLDDEEEAMAYYG